MEKNKLIGGFVPADLAEKFDKYCADAGLSKSLVIRQLVESLVGLMSAVSPVSIREKLVEETHIAIADVQNELVIQLPDQEDKDFSIKIFKNDLDAETLYEAFLVLEAKVNSLTKDLDAHYNHHQWSNHV